MAMKVRRQVGFGSTLEPLKPETPTSPPVDEAPSDPLVTRWRREAIIARTGVGVLLVVGLVCMWMVKDSENRRLKVETDLAEARVMLQQIDDRIIEDMAIYGSLPVTLSSRDDVIGYLSGSGKALFDRRVPLAQQAAFILALTPDSANPRRYTARVEVEPGVEKTYFVYVTDYVHFGTK